MTTVITHNGRFHADEVFGVALLSLGYKNLTVLRTRDVETIDAAKLANKIFVIDIGDENDPAMLNFDHHQTPEATTVASFGLVFKHMLHRKSSKKGLMELFKNHLAVLLFEKILVSKIDRFDNNHDNVIGSVRKLKVLVMQDVVGILNAADVEDHERQQINFMSAVDIAVVIISNSIIKANDMSLAEDRFNACAQESGVLIGRKYCRDWNSFATRANIYTHLYIQDGQWKVVSVDDHKFPLLSQAGDVIPAKLIKKFLAIFDSYDNALTYSKAISGYYIEIIAEVERTKTFT